jgi:hypothetical protein
MLYFTAIGLGLYFFSDWLLNWIEQRRGARFEHRSMIFFAIFLVLALISFQLMQGLMKTPPR